MTRRRRRRPSARSPGGRQAAAADRRRRLIAVLAILAVSPSRWRRPRRITRLGGDDGHGAAPRRRLAGAPPTPTAPAAPREAAPLDRAAEPVPDGPARRRDASTCASRKPPRAGLVFDVDTGDVLWRERPDARAADREPHEDHDRAARAERDAAERPRADHAGGAALPGLGGRDAAARRRVRLEALLNGLLLVSGNDAAIALAGTCRATSGASSG